MMLLRLLLLCALCASAFGCAERPRPLQKDELIHAIDEELRNAPPD